jgi:hypothetical protein
MAEAGVDSPGITTTRLATWKVSPVGILLSALSLLTCPVFLVLSPVRVAVGRRTEDLDQNRDRYDGDNDEDEQRHYRDAQS